MYRYLFKNDHNGFHIEYTPFESEIKLEQQEAEKLILSVNSVAKRIGSSVWHLCEALDNKNYKTKIYKCSYHKPEENHLRSCSGDPSTDPLPDCMYNWPIIEGISGNY